MPICRDPLVANLRAQGFNTLRVPRKDYLPGTVLFQIGGNALEVFGPFSSAFKSGSQVEVSESSKATTFSGTVTSSYRRGMALKLASAWLGVPEAGVRSLFSGATKLSFRFGDLRVLTTSLGMLGEHLAASEASDALMVLHESRLFVVHEVLQAQRIYFVNEVDGDASFGLHVKESLTEMVDLGFQVEASKAAQGLIVFASREYHTIGFKAYEVEIVDGEFHLRRSLESSGFTRMSDEEERYEPALFEDMLV